MDAISNFWKKCSSCKKPISLNAKYYECSVSTCTGERTGYVFCTIPCFEVHLPGAKHRSAGAVEKKAPMTSAAIMSDAPKRIIIQSAANPVTASTGKSSIKSSMENEVLVVVSKMKQYIKDVSDMNTSEDVNMTISHMIRMQLDRAIENARREGRKTVMARDFKN
jgi:histone H3/H4